MSLQNQKVNIFETPQAVAQALANEFQRAAQEAEHAGRLLHVALSGGSTPRHFFRLLSRPKMCLGIPWKGVHVYWADERCVPSDHPDSNFKSAWESFLKFVPIPKENIHRIPGEESPDRACRLYSEMLEVHLSRGSAGGPRFDWVLLGVGIDGHTASLFPGQKIDAQANCGVTHHPETGQARISLGLKVINAADRVSFLVTGEDKAGILSGLFAKTSPGLPAGQVAAPQIDWWLDTAAASQLG